MVFDIHVRYDSDVKDDCAETVHRLITNALLRFGLEDIKVTVTESAVAV